MKHHRAYLLLFVISAFQCYIVNWLKDRRIGKCYSNIAQNVHKIRCIIIIAILWFIMFFNCAQGKLSINIHFKTNFA